MKSLIKKMGSLFLTLCVMVSCLTLSVYAAEGELQFSDPSGEAGETIEVRVKVVSDSGAIGSYEIKASYDPSLLRFESGTDVTASDGILTFTSSADGTQSEALHTLTFTALDEGVSTIDVTECTAALASGEELNLSLGNSTVTVEGGTPVPAETSGTSGDGLSVDVEGKTYTVNTEFMEKDIPMGFTAVETELNGAATRAMVLENGDQYMYYLTDSEGNSGYFLYNGEDGSFMMTEPVMVNNQMTIFLMNYTPDFELPEKFWPTTMTINEKEFSIWNNMDNQDYYLVYAMNGSGTKGFYRYDSVESTYQRMDMSELEAAAKEVPKEEEKPKDNKLVAFLKDNLKLVLIAVGALLLLLLIIIIVLGVKLSRKADDEEYEYDYNTGTRNKPRRAGSSKKYAEAEETDEYDDDFSTDSDDYDGEDYPDDENSSDDYDEFSDEGEDLEEDFSDEDYEFSDDDLGDDFGDALDDYEDKPIKKASKKSKRKNDKDDDDFKIDFIEL